MFVVSVAFHGGREHLPIVMLKKVAWQSLGGNPATPFALCTLAEMAPKCSVHLSENKEPSHRPSADELKSPRSGLGKGE